MSFKFSAAAFAASGVMLASVGTALASPAMVTSNVNVRSGPARTMVLSTLFGEASSLIL